MKPEVKTAWVEALRSGEYNQGQELLVEPGVGYCCLGVLCDLAVKSGEIEGLTFENGIIRDTANETLSGWIPSSGTGLIKAVAEWAGLDVTVHVQTPFRDDPVEIADVNDGGFWNGAGDTRIDPQSFAFIANLIEAQL
jgi:hypothetical protein